MNKIRRSKALCFRHFKCCQNYRSFDLLNPRGTVNAPQEVHHLRNGADVDICRTRNALTNKGVKKGAD